MINFNVKNAKKGSREMQNYVNKYVVVKNGLTGFNYYGFDKMKFNREIFKEYLNSIKIPQYEYLHEDINTKIYFDCEFDDVELEMYDERWNLYLKFNSQLVEYLGKLDIEEFKIVYMDASRSIGENKFKISLHVIINECGVIKDKALLKNIVKDFRNSLSLSFYHNKKNFVDIKVYGIPQLFKIVYSPSKNNEKLLEPFIINNDKIKNLDIAYVIDNFVDLLSGCYMDNKLVLDDKLKIKIGSKEENNNVNKIKNDSNGPRATENLSIPQWKIDWIERNYYIKEIYKIRNIVGGKVNLTRLTPSYCSLCKRKHNSENAFCRITDNNIIFYCGRNSTGISIGNWYKNNESEIPRNVPNINSLLEKIDMLSTENEQLKEEIKRLKNNNIPVKEEDSPKITNKSKEELWNKYYELGQSFLNGTYDSTLKLWNDKNVTRLKFRSLRIYNYVNLLKKKNIENASSLRKILNMNQMQYKTYLRHL